MRQKKDVSVRMIAQKCGVSTATVSRVLNNEPGVSAAKREYILEVLKESGYTPPQPQKLSKIRKVGVILPYNTQDYYTSLLHALTIFFLKYDIQVVTCTTERNLISLTDSLDTLYDCRVAGVIFISRDYLSVKNHLNPKIAHVWIDCNDPPEVTQEICQVQSEQYTSGKMAARELINKGCTQPIILTTFPETHRTKKRNRGFIEEFEQHGIEVGEDRIIHLPQIKDTFTESKERVRYLIYSNYPFDSVFAISDWRALGAYAGVEETGKKVPDDIRIVGYDGVSLACRSVLNITSIQQNVELIAQTAGEQLMKLMNREEIKEKRIIIPTDILQGQSV